MNKTLILLTFIFTIYAEEAPTIPKQAQDAYNKSGKVIYEFYQKERSNLIKELTKQAQELAKAGDLDSAVILKGLLEKVRTNKILCDIIEKEKTEIDILGQEVPKNHEILGRWRVDRVNGDLVEIKDGGISIWINKLNGKWNVTLNKLVISWDNGVIETMILPVKNNVLAGSTNKGVPFIYTKVIEAK